MAARARSRATTASRRRTTAARPKRRPAARRKPAARRGGSRIRWDRVGRIALTFVLAAVLYSYLNPAIDLFKTYTATTAAKAEFQEVLQENKRLHHRIQTADDPLVVSRKARAQGMVAEGETPIVVRGIGG
jgi:cell division protein FtsB